METRMRVYGVSGYIDGVVYIIQSINMQKWGIVSKIGKFFQKANPNRYQPPKYQQHLIPNPNQNHHNPQLTKTPY